MLCLVNLRPIGRRTGSRSNDLARERPLTRTRQPGRFEAGARTVRRVVVAEGIVHLKQLENPGPAVLVVDDDPSVRRALGRLLRSAGFEVTTFASGAELLAHEPPSPPGCVVLDIRLPGMSGIELHRRLRAAGRAFPVVFITGHDKREVAGETLPPGVVALLEKPFDEEALLRAIRQALGDRWRDATN